jgi:macrodomain Ter protein organizer (MatP/YcbG family)
MTKKAYDFVFVSESAGSSDTKDLKSGLILKSCKIPELLEKWIKNHLSQKLKNTLIFK